MEEDIRTTSHSEGARTTPKTQRLVEASVSHALGFLVKTFGGYGQIVRQNVDLFLGATLTIVGLLSFNSDKYCDGNTVEYLSCTRPNAYYYFSGLDIALVVVGVSLMLIWFLKNRSAKKR